MNIPILSIVIPTKDRYETLLPLLDYLISILNSSIEIIIQDNSKDNFQIKRFLEKYNKHNNLKYFHSADDLSVIENCDAAVSNANGEYVCFIGDDDGIMSYTLDVVKWMKLEKIKVLKSYKPHYYWPNQVSSFTSTDQSGAIEFHDFNYTIEEIDISVILNRVLNQGGSFMDKLPSVYHGIIHSSILKNIFSKFNTYFPGPSPDMANAIAITQLISKFTYVHFPVVISGNCHKSTGGQGVRHSHVASIDEVAHLPKNTSKEWIEQIPKYWTGPTIWAQTILKTLNMFDSEINLSKFNYLYLYAYLYIYHFKNRKIIFSNFSVNFLTKINFYFFMIIILLKRIISFIKKRITFFTKQKRGLKNIKEAVEYIENNMDIKKIPIKLND